jgi:hypothetical protein
LTPFWYHQVEHWGKTARRFTLFSPLHGRSGLRCWALRLFDAMAAIPEPLASSAQLQSLPAELLQALEPLLERAPAGLFPRARRLYFDKYPLEGRPQDLDQNPEAGPFRTFVLRETLYQQTTDLPEQAGQPEQADPGAGAEQPDPTPASPKLHELALVHWQQQQQATPQALAHYLRQHWQLEGVELEVMEESWFREGGAWVRITLPGADPAPVEADPETSP